MRPPHVPHDRGAAHRTLSLVLAPLAYAPGSHDHGAPASQGEDADLRLGALIAWPARP